jgi:hypothetical protein
VKRILDSLAPLGPQTGACGSPGGSPGVRITFPDWVLSLLRFALLAGAAWYVLVYIAIAARRVGYPFELQFMEGGSVDGIRRILMGHKLYVRPSLEFTPYIYGPLYFYVSAAASKIIGIGFLAPRMVSFLSSLGSFVLIALLVKQETASWFAGAIACALFAATFQIGGAWFDLARVDSLCLFLVLAAIYFIRFKTSPRGYVLAGVFVLLAFQTKQIALTISLPLMLYCALSNRRRSLYFIGAAITTVAASASLLDWIHHGWYRYYMFDLPRQHGMAWGLTIIFFRDLLFAPLKIACTVSVLYLLAQLVSEVGARRAVPQPGRAAGDHGATLAAESVSPRISPPAVVDSPRPRSRPANALSSPSHHGDRETKSSRGRFLFYFLTTVGMVGGAYLSKVHRGSGINSLLPAYAMIAILCGLALHAAVSAVQGLWSGRARWLAIPIYLVGMAQFAALRYDPRDQIPTARDLAAGRSFIRRLARTRGDVYVPNHGYLPALAGKRTYAQAMAVYDVCRGERNSIREQLVREIRDAVLNQRFSAIFYDSSIDRFIMGAYLRQSYRLQGLAFARGRVFWPVTGLLTRPQFIYVPRPQPRQAVRPPMPSRTVTRPAIARYAPPQRPPKPPPAPRLTGPARRTSGAPPAGPYRGQPMA